MCSRAALSSFSPTRRDAAHIVRTIVDAVVYLHNQGVVHRGAYPSVPLSKPFRH